MRPQAAPLTLDLKGWTLLLSLSVLWGGSFFFVNVAVAEIPPLALVFLRVLIASLTLHVVLFAHGRRSPIAEPGFDKLLLFGAISNVVPFTLIAWAQITLASGVAAVLLAMTPILTMLLAAVFTEDEKLTAAKVIGILIGFGGVTLMVSGGGLGAAAAHLVPALAMLGASLAYAISGIYARRLKGFDPLHFAAGQLTGSALIIAALLAVGALAGVLDTTALRTPAVGAVAAVLALGIVSTAIAYLLYFALIRRAGATNTSLVTYLVPVTAVLLGVAALGERFAPHEIAGMVLIVAGVAAAQGRLPFAGRRTRRLDDAPAK